MARYITIWFRHLKTDWFTVRDPLLHDKPFVLSASEHGRLIITAANARAESLGIQSGMVLADARAVYPTLEVLDDPPKLAERLLRSLAIWCIRYTDAVAIDLPNGLILDVTGCAHLWGGEIPYIRDINIRLRDRGYDARVTMADTIGCAWAIAHYGGVIPIVEKAKQMEALLSLPSAALRLEENITDRLCKLGLRQIRHFIGMPRNALKRRFGTQLLLRLDQALGQAEEKIIPVMPVESLRERLPCMEPIVTATGIEIALQQLLETICKKLKQENKGVRKLVFSGFRVDNKIEKIEIGTNRATQNTVHLFKLFKEKISSIEPALGIEMFMLEVLKSETMAPEQEKLWITTSGLKNPALSELMDHLINRFGTAPIHRYMPDQHHWPERSFKAAPNLHDTITETWKTDRPRPLQLMNKPQRIEVTAPIPDYPPMLFRYLGKLHTIKKADGPERIEKEWWIEEGQHRDYYTVEDEEGKRYWLFRAGHYAEKEPPLWFIHGFFA